MLIPDAFLTEEIRATDDFKEYEMVFMSVDVPMNQPQPVVSTQGTHRCTPRAHKTPTLTTSPQGKKRKQSVRESSSPRQPHKITIKRKKPSTTLIPPPSDDKEREMKLLEPESHKENTEHVNDDDVEIEKEKKDDVEIDKENKDDVEIEKEKKDDEEIEKEKNNDNVKDTDKVVKEKDIVDDVTMENNLKSCIAATIIEDRDAFCSEVPDLVSQEFNAQAPKIIEYLFKNYVQSNVEKTVIDEDEVIPEDKTPELITELQDVDKRVPTIFDYER
ncbi:hypothetical protein Tco_1348058, partial [Tanacetum coccineum]